jgi:hypothetical protein
MDDETEKQQSIPPTQSASPYGDPYGPNPYETTQVVDDYGLPLLAPSPPSRKNWYRIALIAIVSVIVILLLGVGFAVYQGNRLPGEVTQVAPSPTVIPTLQATATPVTPSGMVTIYDQAGVLDQESVRNQATTVGYPVNTYTVNNFVGTNADFDQEARGHVTNARLIVIAIDTLHHHLTIVGGSKVLLSDSQYNDAINAFRNSYSSGGYTGATIAAINSLKGSLQSL